MATNPDCPDDNTLAGLLLGTLPQEQEEEVNRHLEACASCEARAKQLEQQGDPVIDALRRQATPPLPCQAMVTGKTPGPQPPQEPFNLEGYRILAEIGRGGMGVVYRAHQHRLNRLVAIKMILAGHLAGAEERVRFRMEGALLARLNHPNFVQVYEVDTVELSPGVLQPYLVLEHVDGGSLKAQLAQALMPAREAAQLVLVLARAMEAAHAQGIVHRDLKPANVLRACDGTLKIGDFGLAKELGESASLTPTGLALGTPQYMAPEQAQGGSAVVGPATDVYALGAILYEMLAGRPPFEGDTPMGILLQVLEKAPGPPTRLRPGIPRDLETICLKCLEKEPHRRYARAGDLADDLEAWLANRPIQARPVGRTERAWKWARRHPLTAALLALLLLSLVLGSAASSYFGVTAVDRAAETEKALVREGAARQAAEHREAELQLLAGQRVAGDGEVDRGMFLMLRAWEKTPANQDDLGRVCRRNLEAWLGHLPRLRWYVEAPGSHLVAVTDTAVVYAAGARVHVLDAATGRPQGPPREFPGQTLVALSPDGQLVCAQVLAGDVVTLRVFERDNGKQVGSDIVDRRGGELLRAHRLRRHGSKTVFGPDQALLVREFVSPGVGELQLWDIATGKEMGPPLVYQGVAAHLLAARDGGYFWLLIKPAGGVEVRDARSGQPFPGGALGLPPRLERPPKLFPHADVVQGVARQDELYVTWWDVRRRGYLQIPWRLSRASGQRGVSDDGRHLVGLFGNQRLSWHDLASQQLCLPTAAVDATGEQGGGAGTTVGGRTCFYTHLGAFLKRVDFPRLFPAHVVGGTSGESVFRAAAPRLEFSRAALSPDRRVALLAVRSRGQAYARLTATSEGRPLGLPMPLGDMQAAFSPSGRLVALAGWTDLKAAVQGTLVRVHDARTGEARSPIFRFKSDIDALRFSPDERLLAVGYFGGAFLCDLEGKKAPARLLQPGPIPQLLFSPDGRRLALGGSAGRENSKPGVRVWDVRAAKPAGEFVPLGDGPLLLPDEGTAFFTVELEDGRRRRWDFTTAAPVADLGRAAGWPAAPRGRDVWTVHPGKQWLALGSGHGAVWQLDLRTGRRLAPEADFRQPCRQLEYTPDGATLAVSGEDGGVALFDAATGKQVGPLRTHGSPLRGLAFTPDGDALITVLLDGSCVHWPVARPQPLTPGQWRLWLEAATGMRLDGESLVPLGVAEHQERVAGARALPLPLGLPEAPARWHAEQALDADRACQFNSARWHLNRWIALEPKAWLPLARRARLNALDGDDQGAEADLKRAAALAPGDDLANWQRHQAVIGRLVGRPLPAMEPR